MGTLRRNMGWIAAAVVAAVAATGAAKDKPTPAELVAKRLDDARVLLREDDLQGAATTVGEAADLAHKASDLQAERRVGETLEQVLSRARPLPETAAGATADAPPDDLASLLALVMRGVEPERASAYVSAPLLAAEILCESTRTGSFRHVDAAAAVLAKWSRGAKSGAAAKTLASYAAGVDAVAAGTAPAAVSHLSEAFEACRRNGWERLAGHVGIELALVQHAAGDDTAATKQMAAVAALVAGGAQVDDVQTWQRIVTRRGAELPESVRAPWDEVMAARANSSASAAGGAGSAGGAGGNAGDGPQVSAVGRALDELGRGKPFVTVRRTAKGLELSGTWDGAVRQLVEPGTGYRHANDGGVTIATYGPAVALVMVDLVGFDGQPGNSSGCPVAAPLYLLAEGEVWSVSKEGVVSITKR